METASGGGNNGENGDWTYLRDGTRLTELLNEELGIEFGGIDATED